MSYRDRGSRDRRSESSVANECGQANHVYRGVPYTILWLRRSSPVPVIIAEAPTTTIYKFNIRSCQLIFEN